MNDIQYTILLSILRIKFRNNKINLSHELGIPPEEIERELFDLRRQNIIKPIKGHEDNESPIYELTDFGKRLFNFIEKKSKVITKVEAETKTDLVELAQSIQNMLEQLDKRLSVLEKANA